MTTRRTRPGDNRLLTIGAAAGSLVLLVMVVLILWPGDSPDRALSPGRAQADGETVGWVSKVEPDIIYVSSGPFGGGVVQLAVTKATKITKGAKEGWFEDIRPGGQVKVVYELQRGRRLARSVELLVDDAGRPARVPTQVKSGVSTPAPRPTPPPKGAEPHPAMPAVGGPAAVAPASRPPAAITTPAATTPPLEVRATPRREPVPALPKPKPVETAPLPQREATTTLSRGVSAPESASPAPEPARPVELPRPPAPLAPLPTESARGAAGGEATDGSAAVDWLLKGRR